MRCSDVISSIVHECSMDLPLSSLYPSWIDIDFLEHGEPKLAWSDIIAMRTSDDDWHLELLNQLECCIGLVIGGAVPENQSVIPPVPLFFIKELVQLSEKKQSDV